jgi:hypothetical protein
MDVYARPCCESVPLWAGCGVAGALKKCPAQAQWSSLSPCPKSPARRSHHDQRRGASGGPVHPAQVVSGGRIVGGLGPAAGSEPRRPPRSAWTNKLITAKDHASVQINIGHLDANGVYNGQLTTFALAGPVRAMVRAAGAWTRQREAERFGPLASGRRRSGVTQRSPSFQQQQQSNRMAVRVGQECPWPASSAALTAAAERSSALRTGWLQRRCLRLWRSGLMTEQLRSVQRIKVTFLCGSAARSNRNRALSRLASPTTRRQLGV